MRGRHLLAALAFAGIGLVVDACSAPPLPPIGFVMKAPEGLLEQATSVTLSVFDGADSKCGSDGHASNVPETVQTFDLEDKGRAYGISWCKTITLDRDGSTKMFTARALFPLPL